MSLTKGLRDEENERIQGILKKLTSMDYLPDGWVVTIESTLRELGLNLQQLLLLSTHDVVLHLQKMHFDWDNSEQFADFLVVLAQKDEFISLNEKAIGVYNYIQSESKVFSFAIFNKIANAKK